MDNLITSLHRPDIILAETGAWSLAYKGRLSSEQNIRHMANIGSLNETGVVSEFVEHVRAQPNCVAGVACLCTVARKSY